MAVEITAYSAFFPIEPITSFAACSLLYHSLACGFLSVLSVTVLLDSIPVFLLQFLNILNQLTILAVVKSIFVLSSATYPPSEYAGC